MEKSGYMRGVREGRCGISVTDERCKLSFVAGGTKKKENGELMSSESDRSGI